jgi:flagellar protein FlaG
MRVEGSQLGNFKDGATGTIDYIKPAASNNEAVAEKLIPELRKAKVKEISPEELKKKVRQLNKAAEALDRRFQFAIHEETHRIMVKVFRKDNDELIAEIPPKRILDVLARIDKEMGLLVDTKA